MTVWISDWSSQLHTQLKQLWVVTSYRYITNSQTDQLPDDLIAQSVEQCTGIAEVRGSNPVQAYRYITNSQSDQLPDDLIAQSVEHCTGIAEVMG